jgi:rubrerythrin
MDTQFSIFDVLQIAEAVETKTAKFYLRAAERFADEERRSIYYSLADWRAKHRNTWRRIRRRYSEKTGEFGVFDPDNYVRSNPWTMAGLTGYGTDPNGRDRPTGHETREQILHDAIRRSQAIIIFYQGLKEFARNPDSHMMIDNMVNEEHHHVRLLARVLERMQASTDEGHSPAPICSADLEDRL